MPHLVAGKVVLVTGATGGIGQLVAQSLLRAGARVVLHGRDGERLQRSAAALSHDGEVLAALVADLSSLAEVESLAAQIQRRVDSLDVLVNNAGVGFGADRRRRETSLDGHELRFAVNYLAPVLLTERLLALGQPRRAVINVASIGQEELDFADLQSERGYEGTRAYRRSKLALIMWSFDVAARYPDRVVYAIHPGSLLDTGMVRDAGVTPRGPASRGAEVILTSIERALQSPDSGLYFDELAPARAKAPAYDLAARQELRTATLALLPGLRQG